MGYKEAIEDFAINVYCARNSAIIKERRSLPEAIIECKDSKNLSWVEVATAWPKRGTLDQASLARGLRSHNTLHEGFNLHLPKSDYMEQVVSPICESILEKDAKKSYNEFVQKYGKGTLLIIPMSPYLDPRHLQTFGSIKSYLGKNPLKQFQAVWLCLNSSHTLEENNLISHPVQLIQTDCD